MGEGFSPSVFSFLMLRCRNNPLRGDDRPKYVTTPEGGSETTKTRQRIYTGAASPLSDKRPRDSSGDTLDGESSGGKRLRTGDFRNGAEPVTGGEEESAPTTTTGAATTTTTLSAHAAASAADADLEEGEVDD